MINSEEKRLLEIAIAYIVYLMSKNLIELLDTLPNEKEKND